MTSKKIFFLNDIALTNMEELKKRAADEAVKSIVNGMVIGLGTGSTTQYAIRRIGELVKQGLKITGIPTSKQSERLATEIGISLGDLNEYTTIDITIDGADEVDKNLHLIKGGGGALLREKIVATASKRLIIIVDETKISDTFSFPLPIEILPFGWVHTTKKIRELGFNPIFRKNFVTDSGNYIVDCSYESLADIKKTADNINAIPGVIENGFFINLADKIIVGKRDGIETITK
jgi:ribose 5-phosphate isomerase A